MYAHLGQLIWEHIQRDHTLNTNQTRVCFTCLEPIVYKVTVNTPEVYPGSPVHYLQIGDTTTIESHPHKTPV